MLAYNMIVPAQIRGHLLGRPAPYEDALRKVTVPVLVSHGVEDRMALVPMAHYTRRVISLFRYSRAFRGAALARASGRTSYRRRCTENTHRNSLRRESLEPVAPIYS